MQAMKLALPPAGADDADEPADEPAEDAADDAAEVVVAGVLLLDPPELLLPHALNASAAADNAATTKTLCVRRKTLTSPETHG
jgi:hypothetical protein